MSEWRYNLSTSLVFYFTVCELVL